MVVRMTEDIKVRLSVRQRLATDTHDIHEALHVDPVLSRLTSADVKRDEYFSALSVFAGVYRAVETERQRFDVFGNWCLARELSALAIDLAGVPQPNVRITFKDAAGLLGGLYVMHGASFGRTQFGRTVRASLPDVSSRFVSLGPCKETWRSLCDQLEDAGRSERTYARIVEGAGACFSLVEATARRA